jgi:hypothetical protein
VGGAGTSAAAGFAADVDVEFDDEPELELSSPPHAANTNIMATGRTNQRNNFMPTHLSSDIDARWVSSFEIN